MNSKVYPVMEMRKYAQVSRIIELKILCIIVR